MIIAVELSPPTLATHVHRCVLASAFLTGIAGASSCEPDTAGPLVEPPPLLSEVEVQAVSEHLDVYDAVMESSAMIALHAARGAVALSFAGAGDLTRPTPVPLAPPSVLPAMLGTTWIFDAVIGRYVADPGRFGAPGNGVRIALYQPSAPGLAEIGWIDVIEDGAGRKDEYRVQVQGIEAGAAFAAYETKVKGGGGFWRPDEITMKGTVYAGSELVDFDLESKVDKPKTDPTLELDWVYKLVNQDFEVEGKIKDIPITGQGVENIVLKFKWGDVVLDVITSMEADQIEAQIIANGKELATAVGLISQPTIVASAGTVLSQQTQEVIARFFTLVAGIFETYNDLFTPPGAVILRGLAP